MEEKEWRATVKKILKVEMVKADLTYKGLAEALDELGVKETESGVKNKMSRGSFSAVWFIQALRAMEVKSIEVD